MMPYCIGCNQEVKDTIMVWIAITKAWNHHWVPEKTGQVVHTAQATAYHFCSSCQDYLLLVVITE